MSIGSKINEIKGDMTYQEFSKAIFEKTGLEIHWTALQKYITGKRNPSLKTLEILSRYADIPVSHFIPDTNQALRQKIKRLEVLKALKKDTCDELGDSVRIMILDSPLPLPPFSFVGKKRPIGNEKVGEDEGLYRRRTPIGHYLIPIGQYKKEAYAFKVKDNSMIDVDILPGDLVFVRKQEKALLGQTVIAKINDKEIVCKRYYEINGTPVLEPSSTSHYYKSELLSIEIIGVVTKVIRELE